MADADDKGAGAGGADGVGAAAAEPKPAVSFKTEGEFLAAVSKKTKGEVTKAVEAVRAELMEQLGIESFDQVPQLKEQLASTQKTISEAEKFKLTAEKHAKDLEKERRKTGELSGRLVKIAKRDALLPFVQQVRDPEVLAMLADPLLEVDEEGTVTVKNGRSIEDMVGDLLKAKDYLRNPTSKDGAGTTATEPRAGADAKGSDAKGDDKGKNGNAAEPPKYKSFGEAIVADLQARGALPRSGP